MPRPGTTKAHLFRSHILQTSPLLCHVCICGISCVVCLVCLQTLPELHMELGFTQPAALAWLFVNGVLMWPCLWLPGVWAPHTGPYHSSFMSTVSVTLLTKVKVIVLLYGSCFYERHVWCTLCSIAYCHSQGTCTFIGLIPPWTQCKSLLCR